MNKNIRSFLVALLCLIVVEIGFFAIGSWRAARGTQVVSGTLAQATPADTVQPSLTPIPTDTPVPTEAPSTPVPTDTPQPTPQFPLTMMVTTSTQLMALPGEDVIQWLTLGQQVTAQGMQDGHYQVTTAGGLRQGYVAENALGEPDGVTYYAQPPQETGNTLVDVREIIPDIDVHMIYATPDNLMSKTVYDRDVCLLQYDTAMKLRAAQLRFRRDGYSIRIYDAYRPLSVQKVMYDMFPQPGYVANPEKGSNHNRGAAVDIALVDENGVELEMPSLVDTLDETSHRDYKGASEDARLHVSYLTSVMQQCGFTIIPTEWWHYDDANAADYPVSDVVFGQLTFRAAQE